MERKISTRKAVRTLFVLLTAVILTLASCSTGDKSQTSSDAIIFEQKLRALPNVQSVEEYTGKSEFPGKSYIVYFTSLLDPSDSSKGTFSQKAFIGFVDFNKPVCLSTPGYLLYDWAMDYMYAENEAAYLLGCNLVAVEHRYFGESVRTDKTRDFGDYDGSYWEYLSTENAAADLHEIVTSLKTIFSGKWVAQGCSKGGLTANLFCYYYPNDVDLTMPYCAPLCNSSVDSRLYEFILNEAGNNDDRYKSNAAELRKLISDIQLWFLEKRDTEYEDGISYKQMVFEKTYPEDSGEYYNKDYMTPEILYESAVADFSVGVWMYEPESTFDKLRRYLALENDTDTIEEGTAPKKEYFMNWLYDSTSPSFDFTPYYIQSCSEIGNYKFGIYHLRQLVEEANSQGKNITLYTEESKEDTLLQDCDLSAREKAFCEQHYSTELYENMSEWIKTTDEPFIMLYGISDPWYSVRINDVERENVHIFVHPANNHNTAISNFPEEQKRQIIDLLKQYLY